MLRQAALNSAQKSTFECRGCSDVSPYVLTYSFQLRDDGDCCSAMSRGPEVTELQDRVTISVSQICLCDPPSDVTKAKARSAKCFYLWKCAGHVVKVE